MNALPLTRQHFLMIVLVFLNLLVLSGCGESEGIKVSEPLPDRPATGQAGDGTLQDVVNYIRIEAGLPAMAAVLVHNGQIIEMAVSGFRSISSTTAVSVEDKWHLGSLTKSMTSTLAAMLVKQGIINWDTTIADVYPELSGIMNSHYENVRLEQLLSHTSGMRANTPTLNSYHNSSLDIEGQRQKMIEEALVLSPEVNKGEYLYSNLGYMVAGAMMERLTGTSWELLLEQNLFNTLAMTSSGFGVPDAQGNLTQPVGHLAQGVGWIAKNDDNPAVLGPAGTVHSTLEDMGKYIAAHLSGLRGNDVVGLLTGAEFTKLHTAAKNPGYALGWVVTDGALWHNGSNTMWLASINIDPAKNIALFIVTNAADLQKEKNSISVKAVDKLTSELVKRADFAFSN
ncbi:serine hydrolase domain-containing protein [Colwellia piezophila]|uniref:serine hydrolase domain-containing protein n=1 Tax=Colwellia piezophila TaxID=211668 RepID=UPI00035FB9A3|nr:serine hydrolase domain-containing protein [Colwellia piezophila]